MRCCAGDASCYNCPLHNARQRTLITRIFMQRNHAFFSSGPTWWKANCTEATCASWFLRAKKTWYCLFHGLNSMAYTIQQAWAGSRNLLSCLLNSMLASTDALLPGKLEVMKTLGSCFFMVGVMVVWPWNLTAWFMRQHRLPPHFPERILNR